MSVVQSWFVLCRLDRVLLLLSSVSFFTCLKYLCVAYFYCFCACGILLKHLLQYHTVMDQALHSGKIIVFSILILQPAISVCIATGQGAGRPGFNFRQCKNFLFSAASTPTLRPTQPPTQWVPGTIFPEIKRPEREVDHSSLSTPLPNMPSRHRP
jgi:hypothetical protein